MTVLCDATMSNRYALSCVLIVSFGILEFVNEMQFSNGQISPSLAERPAKTVELLSSIYPLNVLISLLALFVSFRHRLAFVPPKQEGLNGVSRKRAKYLAVRRKN